MEPEPEPELLGAARRLSGLWRAKGKTMRGGRTEEFLQLDVSASGVVTGMVDSDGDGVWTEDDCKIAPGTFDAASGALAFVQIYAEPDLLDVRWSARYDAATDTLTDGEWATDDGPGGTFRAARTTEEKMRNRRRRREGEETRHGIAAAPVPARDTSVDWLSKPSVERAQLHRVMTRACCVPCECTSTVMGVGCTTHHPTGRRVFDPDSWEEGDERDLAKRPQLYPVWGTTYEELANIGGPGVRLYFSLLRFLPVAFAVLGLLFAAPMTFNLRGGTFELNSARSFFDSTTTLGKLTLSTIGSLTRADVNATNGRKCVGGSIDLCCGSCVTVESESQTETQLLVYSVLNALAALVLTAMVRVMKRQKAALDGLSDAAMISMSDYTVELRPHKPWSLADATPEKGEDSAAAFKRELKAHLEKHAEGARVATLPDTGDQIWLVFAEEARIKLWRRKTVLLHRLEEALGAVDFNTFLERAIEEKKGNEKSRLQAVDKVAKLLHSVNVALKGLETAGTDVVCCAYVAMEDEAHQDRWVDLGLKKSKVRRPSRKGNVVPVVSAKEALSFHGKRFSVLDAPEPDVIVYEHLQYTSEWRCSCQSRKLREAGAWLLTVLMLLIGGVGIGVSKVFVPNMAFLNMCDNLAFTGDANVAAGMCDGAWDDNFTEPARQFYLDGWRKMTDWSAVVPSQFPVLTDEDCIAGGLSCCSEGGITSWSQAKETGCLRRFDTQYQPRAHLDTWEAIDFPRDGNVESMCTACICLCDPLQQVCPALDVLERDAFCGEFERWKSATSVWKMFAAGIVTAINTALKALLERLAEFEKQPTTSSEQGSLATKVGIAQFVNTVVLSILLSADIKWMGWLPTVKKPLLTPYWFSSVGAAFLLSMVVNVCVPPFVHMAKFFCFRCLQFFTIHLPTLSRGSKTQNRLNDIYTFSEWQLASSFGEVLFICYSTLLLCTAMPALLWIAALGMVLKFWTDKWAVLRAYAKPPLYSSSLFDSLDEHLYVAILLHLCAALVFLSTVGSACPDRIFSGVAMANASQCDAPQAVTDVVASSLRKPYVLPVVIVLCLYVVAMVASSCRGLMRSSDSARAELRKLKQEAIKQQHEEREKEQQESVEKMKEWVEAHARKYSLSAEQSKLLAKEIADATEQGDESPSKIRNRIRSLARALSAEDTFSSSDSDFEELESLTGRYMASRLARTGAVVAGRARQVTSMLGGDFMQPLPSTPSNAAAEVDIDENLPLFPEAFAQGLLVNTDDDYEMSATEDLVALQMRFQQLFTTGERGRSLESALLGKDSGGRAGIAAPTVAWEAVGSQQQAARPTHASRGVGTACLPLGESYDPSDGAGYDAEYCGPYDLRRLVGGHASNVELTQQLLRG